MPDCDVLVLSPFRRPTFRGAISSSYPVEEPWDSPPFLTAGALEAQGLSVELLSLQNIYPQFNEAEDLPGLRDLLSEYTCRLAVFAGDHFIASRSTATVYGIRVVAGILRRSNQEPLVGITGRLATTVRHALFDEVPELDLLVVGESEAVIGPIAEAAVRRGVEAARAASPSVLIRGDGQHEAQAAMVHDLESLALPAYHLGERSLELFAKRRAVDADTVPFSMRTSLGCVFKCKFCAGVPNWRDYRRKSKRRIEAELEALSTGLGEVARLSFLEDEIATRDEDHTQTLNEVLTGRGVRLDGLYTHASMLRQPIARLLKPITSLVLLGLDNASDELLRSMGKGQRLEMVLAAARSAQEEGLAVHLEWIIGTPEEDVESLITSLSAIFSLLSTGVIESLNTYVYCPHLGTEYRARAPEFDMTIHEPYDMQESGGFPASSTTRLTRNQVFTAYLMSQLVISEVRAARAQGGALKHVRPPNRPELRRLLGTVGMSSAPQVRGAQ